MMINRRSPTIKLSVIIPAYNEQERLPQTLSEASAWLDAHLPGDYEIIVVDDGSSDETCQKVREFQQNSNITLLEQVINQGKGAAVRRGMLAATGNYRVFMDADHSTHIMEIEKAFQVFDETNAELIIASRQHPDSDIDQHQSWLRENMGKSFNYLMRSLVHLDFMDTQCGFKAFSKACAEAVFSLQQLDGFSFDVETLYLAQQLGFEIQEIPVRWINEPNSRVNIFSDPAKMFVDIVRIRHLHRNHLNKGNQNQKR